MKTITQSEFAAAIGATVPRVRLGQARVRVPGPPVRVTTEPIGRGAPTDAVSRRAQALREQEPQPFTPEFLLGLFTRAPKAFWRWDVDFSLDAAVRMAEFAETAGVKGTFYVMATGTYNPFSLPNVRALEQIKAHGHRVGMHVDERVTFPLGPAPPDPTPKAALAHASDLFDTGLTRHVELWPISWHMPTAAVLWRDFGSCDSAYGSRWKGHYVSDSRREWDAEKTARLVANAGEGMQCCLHSEHWFGS